MCYFSLYMFPLMARNSVLVCWCMAFIFVSSVDLAVLTSDVADSYIKISACLMQLATADNSNLDKYEFCCFHSLF